MRPAVPLVLALALFGSQASPLCAATGASKQQVRFGVGVAQRGLWAEARFRFERAVALDPRNAAAHNNLAVACEQQGDFARAREAYAAALRLAPDQRQIRQNYDLFREADDKRQRDKKPETDEPR